MRTAESRPKAGPRLESLRSESTDDCSDRRRGPTSTWTRNRPPLGRPPEEWSAIDARRLDDYRRRVVAIGRLEPLLGHLYRMTDHVGHLADVLRLTADELDPDPAGVADRRLDRAMGADLATEEFSS